MNLRLHTKTYEQVWPNVEIDLVAQTVIREAKVFKMSC